MMQTVMVTEGIQKLLNADRQLFNFIADCVRRFKAGDYGEMCAEDLEFNKRVVDTRIGTAYGYYKAYFETGDHANQIWVARDYQGEDPPLPIIVLLPSER